MHSCNVHACAQTAAVPQGQEDGLARGSGGQHEEVGEARQAEES